MKKIIIPICCLSAMLIASCGQTDTKGTSGTNTDTAVMMKDNEVSTETKVVTHWDSVDFTSPIVKYKEVTSKEIDVRGNERYTIYGMSDEVLFSSGKADIREEAKPYLNQVCVSVKSHYNTPDVRVYGYADATGDAAANKELSAQRAMAVKDYIVRTANIAADNIEIVAKGESEPAATNATAEGRQQNRRVRVVAMNK
ncbi:hypothetical protein CJD36_020355 [Flavipsychrobacter stenotrophus]|uniref:OmpA-like domain-containing protein n=1 Tax=Flavipsychrobacter stenotrophus TaxID=2077091 RepID=A0A2S7SRB1_9BACT|nr:OmpA family protein [Flavipsychrobacter stenotrophus]PQJ09147.1 hypothetical protein CJD36_020355 [Flavipsychrobacter stenotrophus]